MICGIVWLECLLAWDGCGYVPEVVKKHDDAIFIERLIV